MTTLFIWTSSLNGFGFKRMHLKYSYLDSNNQKPKRVLSGIEDLLLTKKIIWILAKQRKLIFLRLLSLTSRVCPLLKFFNLPDSIACNCNCNSIPCNFHFKLTQVFPFPLGNLNVHATSLSLMLCPHCPFFFGLLKGRQTMY